MREVSLYWISLCGERVAGHVGWDTPYAPLPDHASDARHEPSALASWIPENLYCEPKGSRGSFPRKGEVYPYVGRSLNLTDLKDRKYRGTSFIRKCPPP